MSIFKRLVILSFATKLFLTLPLLASAPVINIPYSSLFLDGRYQTPPMGEIRTYGAVLGEIIRTESGGDPTAQNPNSTAYGLCQFIDGTWQYVQDKWNMKLDRYNSEDQLYACKRLLEEEGLKHWPGLTE